MAQSARRHCCQTPQSKALGPLSRDRLRRLQHLRPLSHQQQVALVGRTRRTHPAKRQPSVDPVDPALRDEMLSLLPNLRAFALSLTNDPTRADDLVQETLLRAWANFARFERGSNLAAWLFTILRHAYYTEHRKHKHEVEDPEGAYTSRLVIPPGQEDVLELDELRRALTRLPRRQREALLMVGAEGLSYEAVAAIQGVAEGTIKSRVNRARFRLSGLLHMRDRHEIGPDQVMQAALQEPTTWHP